MIVAVITFHNTSNFGATLQCSAMSYYLEKCGYDVEIINYLPQYVLDKKSIYKELRKVRESGNKAKALVKGIAYLSHSKELRKRDGKFEEFIRNNLKLSEEYHSYEELKQNPPAADFYFCGSDQIWNPALTGNTLDKAFFLQFTDGPRAAYGASIGELDVVAYAADLNRFTDSYCGISVREKSAAALLKDALNKDVNVVLDCTLLLDKEDYRDMEADVEGLVQPYLLLYNIQNSEVSVAVAKKIAREKNLRIVDLSPNPFAKIEKSKKVIDIGPGEFLTYVKNAEYVVTNSFHGTVFSIIYNKPFFTIPHKTRSSRTVDLLESLQLEERLVKDANDIKDERIDYIHIMDILKTYRKNSIQYIKEVLSQM